MNGRERVLAALEGRAVDRRPVSLVLSLYGAKLTECPLQEYYTSATAYARGQSAVLETYRPDILFGPFTLPMEASAFGCRVRYFENQAPNLAQPAISSAAEIDQLAIPDVDSHPRLTFFREAIRQLVAEHGGEVPIAAVASNPVDLPALLLGIDEWLNTLLFDEDRAKRVLELSIGHAVRWIRALFSEGADFVVVPAVFVNPTIVLRQIAERITIPAMKETLSEVDGPIMVHSGGAPLAHCLDLLSGLPNVVSFVLNPQDSFAEARDKVGPQPTLVGNIDGPTLFQRKREDIRANCLEVLQDRQDDPHFVLGTSAADIGFDTPPENIHVIREAADAFASGESHG